MPKDEFRYYLADSDGVTHRTLNAAEHLASSVFKSMEKLSAFSKERNFELVIAWLNDTCRVPALAARQDSIFGFGVSTDVVDLNQRLNSARIAHSIKLSRLYAPRCQGAGGVCCAYEKAANDLEKLEGYRNIEERIVADAHKAGVAAPAAAETSSVPLSNGMNAHAQAFQVFADWIYRVPVSAATGRNFRPPQSRLMTPEDLRKKTVDSPLDDFRSDHRQIWYAVRKLRQVVLG